MKSLPRLLSIFTLFFTLMFSSTSSAKWTQLIETIDGETFYLDLERIRKVDGYVYFWCLLDLLKPTEWGDLSVARYFQGDCKLFRFKILSSVFHKQPMGRDVGETVSAKNTEWKYPSPDTTIELALNSVCTIYK